MKTVKATTETGSSNTRRTLTLTRSSGIERFGLCTRVAIFTICSDLSDADSGKSPTGRA